jgi:single-stranded-DNA-specific exonuclease
MGIAGLVASRLTEEFYRPAVVIHTADAVCHASCLSIPEFDIIDALNKLRLFFSRYGGHSAAAGFTMPTKNLPELENELSNLVAEKLAGIELQPRLDIDAQVKLSELAGETFATTQMLAPFGHGNPVPVFLSRGVELLQKRTMGNSGEHLRMTLKQDGTTWDCVAFRLSNHEADFAPRIDVVYNVEVDNWGGKKQLRLNILDFKRSL